MEENPPSVCSQSNWPGEREPSGHDVEAANELPEPSFLSEFKNCLLSSPEGGLEIENIMHLDLHLNPPSKYTYPLTLLSEFPLQLPLEDELAHLRDVYAQSCGRHPFLNRLHIRVESQQSVAAPLSLAVCCLGSVHAGDDPAKARDLFLASRGLLGAMMEVDNRESRSSDLLMAATLNSVYGALSSDADIWDKAGQTLCTSMTIARRMRYHDPKQLHSRHGSLAPSYSGALIWCLWLIDIVQALHLDLSVNLFTSRELRTSMPDSSSDFQDVYGTLMDDRPEYHQIDTQKYSQDDALLLLMAILSDLLHLRASLGQVAHFPTSMARPASTRYNPYAPFSPRMEMDRIQSLLALALDKWSRWFHAASMSPEILALYHYTRMYLSFDRLLSLPAVAGYRDAGRDLTFGDESMAIPDNAVREAWYILDNAAARPQAIPSGGFRPCAMWLPIVVLHAALVVWAHYSTSGGRGRPEYGSTRILLAFKIELDGMPWPCCVEMAATLGRLIAKSGPVQEPPLL